MHERDVALVALIAQRAEHRYDRCHAAAAADQHEALGPTRREHEVALSLGEVKHLSGAKPVAEVPRDESLGMGGHRQLEQSVGAMLRAARRIRAGAAHAVDVDADPRKLPGLESGPGGVGAKRQRHAALGLMVHGNNARAGIADGEVRTDQLQVPVDPVRANQKIDQGRLQQPAR